MNASELQTPDCNQVVMPRVGANHPAPHDVASFIDGLERLPGLEDVAAAMPHTRAPFGLAHLISADLPTANDRFEDRVIATRWPAEFFRLYVENDYARVDP